MVPVLELLQVQVPMHRCWCGEEAASSLCGCYYVTLWIFMPNSVFVVGRCRTAVVL
jgi:hypothetical protein